MTNRMASKQQTTAGQANIPRCLPTPPRGHSVRRGVSMFALERGREREMRGRRGTPPGSTARKGLARVAGPRARGRALRHRAPRARSPSPCRARAASSPRRRGATRPAGSATSATSTATARDDADDADTPGDLDADDVPTSSGDFSRKLSLEISKRAAMGRVNLDPRVSARSFANVRTNLDVHGTETIEYHRKRRCRTRFAVGHQSRARAFAVGDERSRGGRPRVAKRIRARARGGHLVRARGRVAHLRVFRHSRPEFRCIHGSVRIASRFGRRVQPAHRRGVRAAAFVVLLCVVVAMLIESVVTA